VEQVRGVGSGSALSTLLEKELVRIMGRAETVGKPLLYGTSDEFLSHVGLNRLEDLPDMLEIESLLVTEDEERETQNMIPEERRRRLMEGVDRIGEMISVEVDEPETNTEETPSENKEEIAEALQKGREEERAALQGEEVVLEGLKPEEFDLQEALLPSRKESNEEPEEITEEL
jgi:segregation and condensation protein B